ncbi:MAG TPA: tetratricopeptide repeat protein [Polyangiaceae bacterium]
MRQWTEANDDALGADPPWQEDVYLPPRRRRMGAWIVVILLSLSLGLVGWAGEKRFHVVALVKQRLSGQRAVDAVADPRAESFVAEGERAFSEGRLEVAQGDFDKASVLTDHDPRVLLDVARIAAAKADVPWLKLRLLPPGATDEGRLTKLQLDEQVAAARQTADDALAVAPHDPDALRAKLDALRLAGDVDGARGYVVAVFSQASQPETAYALGALDLLQASPPWATIVDRLRVAADGEGTAGRARATLVYALARSGDAAGAKVELAKLDAQPRPYPLLAALHALDPLDARRGLDAPAAPNPLAAASINIPTAPANPTVAMVATVASAPPAPGTGASTAGDTTFQAAADAVRRGEYDRAERIYQGIVAMHPRDSQALSGLGDVRRLHNDPWGAIDAYQRAIEINPSYLPALVGLADTQWARGDRDGATRSYKKIVDRFPETMVPAYVSERAAQ